ncbi:MAG TPA: hypothetical protein VK928_05820 [Longimicrobiales bacterium]|nr:hypothetical protein [Longimicrobiales bacterium]
MIRQLLLFSPQFKAGVGLSATSLVMLLVPSGAVHLVGLSTLLMLPVLWMPQPAALFVAALPVDARRHMLAHLGVGMALTCLPVIAWVLSGYVQGASSAPGAAFLSVSPHFRLAALPIAALAIVLPNVRQPGVLLHPDRIRSPAGPIALLVAVSAALIGLLPIATATVILTGALVAALAITWYRMPRSYQAAPAGAGGAGRSWRASPAAAAGADDTGRPQRPAAAAAAAADGHWWRPLRAAVLPGRTIFGITLIGFMAIGDMWMLYVIILMVPELGAATRQRLHWLHALPFPRTAMLWATLGPPVLALVAVAVVGGMLRPALLPGFNAFDRMGRPHEYSRTDGFDSSTKVPLAFWRIAPRGEPPVVRAPWGESTTTDVIALPGLTLYNPWSVRTGSSPELVEWQFGRATAAVHGRSFTTAAWDADGFVAPPRVTRNARVFLLGASLALTFVILLVWLAELEFWYRLSTRPVLRYGATALFGSLAGGVVVLDLLFMFGHRTQFVVPAGTALALRLAQALPNIGVVAIVASLPVAAAYALLHRQVSRSDVIVVSRSG